MPTSLSGRNFLKLLDFTPDEIRYLIKLSKEFKNLKLTGTPHRYLEGKNIVLLFEKTSTRHALRVRGGRHGPRHGRHLPRSRQLPDGQEESIEDTARVLGRMSTASSTAAFSQEIVEDLAANAGVPVWNGLTTEFHPTQMIADMLTVEENFPQGLKGLKFVFMGDAENNVANSLMVVCAKLGLHFVACGPEARIAEGRSRGPVPRGCRRDRRHHHADRGREGGLHGRQRHLHRHLGVHGRAGRALGRAHQALGALPRDEGSHGHGLPGRHLHALPAVVPRHQDHHRRRDRRAVSA